MKTYKESSSITVRENKSFFLGDNGKNGDQKIELWQTEKGVRFLNTNGDPIWENEDGFYEVAAEILKS